MELMDYDVYDFINEEDFKYKRINSYIKLNETYYMKVESRIPNENILSIEDLVVFRFVDIKKIKEKVYKEINVGERHVITGHVVCSRYLSKKINRPLDSQYCLSDLLDEEGRTRTFPLYDNDILVKRPKTLELIH